MSDLAPPAPTIAEDAAEPVVRIRGLRKSYGSFTAVDGIDLDIFAGETFALLGPNGAGKSTTVEILEGFRDRSSGEVSVLGVDPAHANAAWKARIGVVLQNESEPAPYSVREQLRAFAELYPAPRDIDEVIASVGLTEQADVRLSKLSGGQLRRVDVALGIVGRPELLFLDEPTTGFDPQARRDFWQLIRTLGEQGTTIILTTHYLDEAEYLAQRVGVIDRGRLLQVSPMSEIGDPKDRVPRVRWRDAEGRLQERITEQPGAVVSALLAEHGGAEPPGLEVMRPRLEEIYLSMIGQSQLLESDGVAR